MSFDKNFLKIKIVKNHQKIHKKIDFYWFFNVFFAIFDNLNIFLMQKIKIVFEIKVEN